MGTTIGGFGEGVDEGIEEGPPDGSEEGNVEGARGRTPDDIADCCFVSEDVVTSDGIRESDWGGVAEGEK